jgi:hypothetical protein
MINFKNPSTINSFEIIQIHDLRDKILWLDDGWKYGACFKKLYYISDETRYTIFRNYLYWKIYMYIYKINFIFLR